MQLAKGDILKTLKTHNMKKVEIPNPKQQQLINWDTPQWVVYEYKNIVILTTGENDGETFTGTCLPCEPHPNGRYSNAWLKKYYSLLTFDIPFTISNE